MLNSNTIDKLFDELSHYIEKPTSIVVCGGVSMVLNYESRQSTRDVDCVLVEERVKLFAGSIADSYNLECDWLNDNVCVTQSYSEEILKYKAPYKKYGDLSVYTIKGIPLLCMKLVSWRPNSSDYDDCKHIIETLRNNRSIDDVYKTMKEIYGSTSVMSVDAEKFLQYEFKATSVKLDRESVESLAYTVQSGLQSLEDLPLEFREQVVKYLKEEVKCQ